MKKKTLIVIASCVVWFTAGFLVCNATTWKHYYSEGFVSGYTTFSDTIQYLMKEKIVRDTMVLELRWEKIDHDTFSVILGKKMIDEELNKK